ncbi:MAG: hypothetical protein KY434_00005 [Actinobacteria bacterium]|nr:hypothetical protein [Actinomycetota bacterium]
MGRPTKLTPELAEPVVSTLRAGAYLVTAAAFASIDESTLHEWLARGRGTHGRRRTARFAEFAESVARARAEAEVRSVDLVVRAGVEHGDTASLRWWLERSFPHRWGGRQRVEHSGPEGGPITIYDPSRVRESPAVADAARDYLRALADEAAVERAAGASGSGDE